MDNVILVPPRADWAELAQRESQMFVALLGETLVRIHHVGSTSIPGIWAKPIIDLIPEVRDVAELDQRRELIEQSGYEFWGEYGLPGRRLCLRAGPGKGRVANIHCYPTGSPEIARHLAFRDYLRAFPDVAHAYQVEKLRARELHPTDVHAYNDEKNPWIRRTELEALTWVESLENA